MSLPPLVAPAGDLSMDEVRRYSRHLIIPDVGMDGQRRLKNARVLCVGAGGLGSPALMYLAAAGVGTLGIIEFDVVDESNLQRQIIHGHSDIGRSKAESARESVTEINPFVQVNLHTERLDSSNAMELFAQYDLIVDGTDNFATRYLVNDACVLLGKPYVWGSIYRFDGQASVFWAENGPCYRCLYPDPPPPGMVPSCAEGGVLGVLCASIGSIQVTEAIKLITGVGDSLLGRLMVYDAREMDYRQVTIRKDPNCVACGDTPTVTELIDYELFCGVTPDSAADAVQDFTISVHDLKAMLDERAAGSRASRSSGASSLSTVRNSSPKVNSSRERPLRSCRRTSRWFSTAGRVVDLQKRSWPQREPDSMQFTSVVASTPGFRSSNRTSRRTDFPGECVS